MTDLRQAAQQALEALEKVGLRADTRRGCDEAVGILRAALAQQEEPAGTQALIEECLAAFAQELAAWDIDPPLHHVKQAHDKCEAWLAAPPQRKPLTEEEIEACRQQGYAHAGFSAPFDFGKAARAVERAHGIKEN